jgi:V/A-type H+-transporting ATPase subunit E
MDKNASHGVQQLIDRLKGEGVEAGQKQADTLLQEARTRATHILEQAAEKAKQMTEQAEKESAQLRKSAEAALKLALRDATLKLREEIIDRFAKELRQLVGRELRQPDFLKQALLEITRQAVPADTSGMKVLLPAEVATIDDLRRSPDELQTGSLSQFASSLAKDLLAKGIELVPTDDRRAGVRVELAGNDVRVEATDQALTQLLLKHLTPRFRALMEGMAS